MLGEKFRFRFCKTGSLRFLSHHDLMRTVERMLRRAQIPFKSTGGFHPTPRFIFALSLPLGVIGRNEVLELEVTTPLEMEEVRERLNRQSPVGLSFHAVRCVDMKASAMPRRAVYQLTLTPECTTAVRDTVRELLEQDKIWAERTHPKPRRVNIKPYIRRIDVREDAIELDLWVTQSGTAKAEEILRLLGLSDQVARGAILERINLEIQDEVEREEGDQPPDGPAETTPWVPPAESLEEDDTDMIRVRGMTPTEHVVE